MNQQVREAPARTSSARAVLGVILILAGGAWLLDRAGFFDVSFSGFLALALVVIGLALMVTRERGSRGGLITLGIFIIVYLLLAPDTVRVERGGLRLGDGFGDRLVRPVSFEDVADEYSLEVGQLTVDLSRVDFPEGAFSIRAKVSAGRLLVLVPSGAGIEVRARIDTGGVEVLQEEIGSGINVEETYVEDGYDDATTRLVLDLSAGIGSIEVKDA